MITTAKKTYHYLLALAGALFYRFPSRQLYVVAVTGTKGKSSTVEMTAALLAAAGHKVASSSTVQFKIGEKNWANKSKMTMPGRAFLQKFLRQAVKENCHYAVLEMSSQGAIQFRHKFIDLDALIFTNLAPEHLEAHGSYEKYLAAKLLIVQSLANSPKPNKLLIVNGDDKETEKLLTTGMPRKIIYRLAEAPKYILANNLPGEFNRSNWLAAATFARTQSVSEKVIEETIKNFRGVRGRMEKIASAPFEVIIDYAHTPDSLEKVYQTLQSRPLICVLGGTGGGRDKWKRPVMGGLAARYCQQIFLTNEDPYDEDPREIIEEVAGGIKDKSKFKIIIDRREAIRAALKIARPNETVIITGKGTDPVICGPRGKNLPWDDAAVAREELAKLKNTEDSPR